MCSSPSVTPAKPYEPPPEPKDIKIKNPNDEKNKKNSRKSGTSRLQIPMSKSAKSGLGA